MALQDLRNHGHSFHSTEHNYGVMAEDVEKFIQQQKLDKCVLIGHSMCVSFCFIKEKKQYCLTYSRGAKTAMAVALRSPNIVSALMPVDNAPVNAALKSDFDKYVRGMQQIEAEKVKKQSDADKILQNYEEV